MPSNSPTPEALGAGLYVVATPIGHLSDITLRALDVLARVDLIAAEDTRHTRRLLEAHHIRNRLVSYHEHNEIQRTQSLIEQLVQGASVALVTNAGTPTVSDPGYRLVRAAGERGIPVIPIPGVSAVVTALSVSGLGTDQFTFIGFPPRKTTKRRQHLQALCGLPQTLVFYQSPQRLLPFIGEIIEILGDRRAMLARELTKMHEELLRGKLSELAAVLAKRDAIKGECTLLIEGAPAETACEDQDVDAVIRRALEKKDRPLSELARELSVQLKMSKKQVYERALQLLKED